MVMSQVANREGRERGKNKKKIEVTSAERKSPYREVISSLLYFANTIRRDIVYAVNVLSSRQISSTFEEWKIVKRLSTP